MTRIITSACTLFALTILLLFRYGGGAESTLSFVDDKASTGNGARIIPTPTPLLSNREHDAEAVVLVAELSLRDASRRAVAREQILEKANESEARRETFISELIRALASYQDRQQIGNNDDRQIWDDSIDVLGDLRAVEALPYLIEHLDWGGGIAGDSHSSYRAYKAVVKLGDQAVPGLEVSLRTGRPQVRLLSARALTQIGGNRALAALEAAYESEVDANIREVIHNSIDAWKRKK